MERYQNGDLLGMIGRGTPGGLRRVDGSSIEPGVHLRWQLDPELGFPAGGFDVYRRNENNGHYWRCGSFIEVDVVGVAWYPHNTDHFRPGLTLTFTGRGHLVPGCTPGATDAASFPGDRVVRLNFGQPVRVVRIVFHPDTPSDPIAEAYCASPDGPVQVARRRSRGALAIAAWWTLAVASALLVSFGASLGQGPYQLPGVLAMAATWLLAAFALRRVPDGSLT